MTLIKQYLAQTYECYKFKHRDKILRKKINKVTFVLQFQPPLV